MPALPGDVTYGTVTGKLVFTMQVDGGTPDAIASRGSVTFTPSPKKMQHAGADLTILPRPIAVPLEADGSFSTQLVATDSPGLSPTGWTWEVSASLLDGGSMKPFSFALPGGTTVDLTDLSPVPSADGTYYARGDKGDQGIPGPFAGPAEVAAANGYFLTVSDTAPVSTTQFGVPVVWLKPTGIMTLIPTVPTMPSWDYVASTYTIPTGVVGVQYENVDTGAVLTQGTTINVGARPVAVNVRAVALPGYTLSAPAQWYRYFFDPAVVTLRASDGFSGAAVDDITGRAADMALGGSLVAPTWAYRAAPEGGVALGLDGSGRLILTKAAGDTWTTHQNHVRCLDVAERNMRAETVVSAVTTANAGVTLACGFTTSYLFSGITLAVFLSATGVPTFSVSALASNGGTVYLVAATTVPSIVGTWTLDHIAEMRAWRVVTPTGTVYSGTYEVAASGDATKVKSTYVNQPSSTRFAVARNGTADPDVQVDSVKIYKIG